MTVFRSAWLDADIKYKKDALFVMTRAARPFVLSGYFFFASYETYTKVRRRAGVELKDKVGERW